MERKKLTAEEIETALAGLIKWEAHDNRLKKRFSFSNFAESLAFVNKIGEAAEASDHHPDIKLGWGYAEIEVTTHDRGGITAKDFGLAQKIDGLGRNPTSA